MWRIVSAVPLANWRIQVRFEDGVEGVFSLAADLFGPMFEPLRDPNYFAKLSIDEFGVICWPNGADLAPDAIHADLLKLPKSA